MLQHETTADILFDQDHKTQTPKGGTSGRYLWKQAIGIVGWALLGLWCSWVTLDLLSRRCGEHPLFLLCSSVLGPNLIVTPVPTVSPQDCSFELDHTPQRNFALGGDGALIFKGFTSPTYTPVTTPAFSVFEARAPPLPPLVILDDSLSVGRCWEIKGSEGHVGIGLTEMANISSLSFNHVHPSLVTSASSRKALREFRVWGLYPPQKQLPETHPTRSIFHFLLSESLPIGLSPDNQFILLVNGTYDTSSPLTHQVFKVPTFLKHSLNTLSNVVVLEILSNWGAQTTCLYNVEIHGEPHL